MRIIAERIHDLSPNDIAAQGLLGSFYLGDWFYSGMMPENILSVKDATSLDKAIKLLKDVVKDKFPNDPGLNAAADVLKITRPVK